MRTVKLVAVSVTLVGGLVLLLTASSVSVLPSVKAGEGCSVNTLKGNYAGTWSGLLFSGAAPPAAPQPITAFFPYDAMEVSTFDGAGNFTSTVTANGGGTPAQSFPDSGTYTVSTNCTGSLTLASGLTFDFVIFNRGAEVKFAETDGNVAAVTETRLDVDQK